MPQALSPELARRLQLAPALKGRERPGTAEGSGPTSLPATSPRTPRLQQVERKQQDEDLDVWIHSHYYAKGGQKKKALTALSKHARGGVSVHEVPEVQKINACTSRINVKLEFYRDHDEQFDPLLRTVEEAFMCQESGTGEPLVNVAKLRSANRPKSQASRRQSAGRNLLTPDLKAIADRDRGCLHRDRICQAVAKAKLMQVERRTEHAWRLHLQQTRQERARRERPWLSLAAAVVGLAVMRKIAETWQQARQETARALQGLPAQHALPVFSFHLDDWHAERLSRAVAAMRSREHQRFRSQSIWRQWTHLLLTLIVWIKLRRPLRKKSAIETVKNLMRAAARPYQFRCAVKHFMQAVLLVQRAMRHQAQIFKVMQNRIFKPLVWATETQLICDAFRMRKAEAAAKIESQMHAFKVKHWEEEVRLMSIDRAHVWRHGCGRFRAKLSRISEMEEEPMQHHHSSLQKTLELMSRGSLGHTAKNLRKSFKQSGFLMMETLRMESQDCEEITRQMLLTSIDVWWGQFSPLIRFSICSAPYFTQNHAT
ncbi:unnamed protein product [Effrenium voratum]|nr:unnamed protein product [Effrenium voratum]